MEARLTNIGPIDHLVIPLQLGVNVLRGRNGKGKSIALEAVDALVRGQGKPTCKDGTAKGVVEGLGARLHVGKAVRRTGAEELEVRALEGRLDISQIVDPGVANPESADERRIKALIQFSGVPLQMAKFHELLGTAELFDSLVTIPDLDSEDWLTVAGRVKRRLEGNARNEEEKAKTARIRAEGLAQSWQDTDLTAESDEAKLQAALEQAIRDGMALKDKAESVAIRLNEAREAKDKLAVVQAGAGQDHQDLLARQEVALSAANEAMEARSKADFQFKAALEDERMKKVALAHASELVEIHQKQAGMLKKWEEQVEAAGKIQPVSADALSDAAQAVQEARQSLLQGAMVRKAQLDMKSAQALREDARKAANDAEWLRERAKGTDDVLSWVVGQFCDRIRVVAGRLVTATSRGQTFFADLSDGERWMMALEIVVGVVGTGGLIVIPQLAWEGLDPVNRASINARARELGVIVLTAEASEDEELKVEAA